MSSFYASKILKILNRNKIDMAEAKILMLGITFKEDCPDVRNSKVIDLINEIKLFRSSVDVYDPIANNKETRQEFKINIIDKPRKSKYDLVVIAVGHQIFKKIGGNRIRAWCKPDGIIVDLKNTIPKNETDFTL